MNKIKLINGYEKLKYNYTLKKYSQIQNIFGSKNHALTFMECDLSHSYHKKLEYQFNKYCKPINDIYDDFIYGVAKLICSLKENPSIDEIMYIYGYLYYNGYLSVNNIFKFDVPDAELPAKKSLSIFTGKGVCRNIGDMFIDVLKVFNIKSFGIITDHDTYESEPLFLLEQYEDIVTKDEEEFRQYYEANLKEKLINTGTHFEVVALNKKFQVIDPTELCVYNLTKKENDYPSLNYLRLWSLYSMGTHSIKQTVQLYNIFKNRYLDLHKGNNIFEMQEECFNICEKNKSKLYKFHKKYNNHIQTLSDTMEELKK